MRALQLTVRRTRLLRRYTSEDWAVGRPLSPGEGRSRFLGERRSRSLGERRPKSLCGSKPWSPGGGSIRPVSPQRDKSTTPGRRNSFPRVSPRRYNLSGTNHRRKVQALITGECGCVQIMKSMPNNFLLKSLLDRLVVLQRHRIVK